MKQISVFITLSLFFLQLQLQAQQPDRDIKLQSNKVEKKLTNATTPSGPGIFVNTPVQAANGAGTRIATGQASTKPGLKREVPPPAPPSAAVPVGEISYDEKNGGGGIRIYTAIVIYWPPITDKNSYRKSPPDGSTIFYPDGTIDYLRKANSGTTVRFAHDTKEFKDKGISFKYGDILIDDVPIDPFRIQIDTAIVIKWPADFQKISANQAKFSALATFISAKGKIYHIDLDSDKDGFFDAEVAAGKLPAGTLLLYAPEFRKVRREASFGTYAITKKGETTPIYTMQLLLPEGIDAQELFKKSEQAANYMMQEISSTPLGMDTKINTSKNDPPLAFPIFDANGDLLYWATEDGIVLTFATNAGAAYRIDTFMPTYDLRSNELPKLKQTSHKKLRIVPHTESSIDAKRFK